MNKCIKFTLLSCFIALRLTIISIESYAAEQPLLVALKQCEQKGYGGENSLSHRYRNAHAGVQDLGDGEFTPQEIDRLKCASVSSCTLKEHKHDRPTIYYVSRGDSGHSTMAGTAYDIDFYNLIKKSYEWRNAQDYPTPRDGFQYCWDMGTWFPTRHLTSDTPPLLSQINLTPEEINSVFLLYTSHNNYACAGINIILTMHVTDDIMKDNDDRLKGTIPVIQQLNSAICIQACNDKSKGLKAYRGTMLSPIGLLMMKIKKTFFFPPFVSASLSEEACYWDPFECNRIDPHRYYIHNVKFVIDLSEYWKRAAVIERHQTEYPDEQEITLSCYNLYEYQGEKYSEENETLYVYLKVKDAHEYKPEELVFERNNERYKCNMCTSVDTWMAKRGEVLRTIKMTSQQLYNNATQLYENFNNHFDIITQESRQSTKSTIINRIPNVSRHNTESTTKKNVTTSHSTKKHTQNFTEKGPQYNKTTYPRFTLVVISVITLAITLDLFLKGENSVLYWFLKGRGSVL